MAKKQTIQHLIHNELVSRIAFGNSKHEDKKLLNLGKVATKYIVTVHIILI